MSVESERQLDDEALMRLAMEQAEEARSIGEVPIGAVVVSGDGQVIARGFNHRESWQDPTAHAELIAMRRAADELGSWRLEDCTVYVTLEPCPMCAGTLINARVARVVFGARDPKAGAVRSFYELCEDERFNHQVEVVESSLAEECGELITQFFRDVRAGRAPPKPTPDDD